MPPNSVDYETRERDARHWKKGRDSLNANRISTFAADGTPLPKLDTSEVAMRKNRKWIDALLNWGKDEEDK